MSDDLDDSDNDSRSGLSNSSPLRSLDRLRTRIERRAAAVVVHIDGDIDITTAEMLRVQVITAALSVSPPRVVLDMHKVAYCDSSGLGALVAIYRVLRADADGRGGLVVARPPSYCREILQRTGLDQRLTIADSLEDAMRLVDGSR